MTGKQLMSELQHVMTFLSSMGYDVTKLSIEEVVSIKAEIQKTLVANGFTREIIDLKDAF